MDTLKFIVKKYKLDLNDPSPIEIPNMGRDNLAGLFKELGFKTGVEVGTERGIFAEVLCKGNPGLKLFCIDPWTKIPNYRKHVKKALINEIYQDAKHRLLPFDCKLVRDFSENAIGDFEDESLDFIYIDGNHDYEHASRDLEIWSKKVRHGGIIAGHDYFSPRANFSKNNREEIEVVRAVNDFVRKNQIIPWFLIGLRAKIPGTIRDAHRSYMWVKL